MKYTIPDEYYFRLHHSRPRFKNDVENVLLFMATEISRMEPCNQAVFREKLNSAIKLYPGNFSLAKKTIDNWRTEISSLFGLIEYNGDERAPSQLAKMLADEQDLVKFFRYFLYFFQYPGAHLKSQEAEKIIRAGIKFKPAKYILSVLLEGQKITGKQFGITKAEATHCIFNDLRVTRDNLSPEEVVRRIIANREAGYEYDTEGDIIRYAGDILDYMELADLLHLQVNHRFYIKSASMNAVMTFVKSDVQFNGYDNLYNREDITPNIVALERDNWFKYTNNLSLANNFEADILSILSESGEATAGYQTEDEIRHSEIMQQVIDKIYSQIESKEKITTKDIGDLGESITITHEKNRLTSLGREELIHLVQKIPEHFGVGYDIGSYEGIGTTRRLIEVKTTISRSKLHTMSFHMTPSEWSAAETFKDTYYVYRLIVSSGDIRLFVIKNPVGQYKNDLITMVPRDGADIDYNEQAGVYVELQV